MRNSFIKSCIKKDPNKQFHYITGKILATKLISTTQYFFIHYDIQEHGQYCLLQKIRTKQSNSSYPKTFKTIIIDYNDLIETPNLKPLHNSPYIG